jgi:hypothetical protein
VIQAPLEQRRGARVALGARVDKSVAVGGDALAVAALQNADALTDYLADRFFGAAES